MTRPVWHEFPMDKKTWNIDTQFMLGPGIMVSPILEQGKITRQVCTKHLKFKSCNLIQLIH